MESPVPYDPIAVLMAEHQQFLIRLREFRTGVARVTPAGMVEPTEPRRIASFADFLLHDVDQLHGRKEERGLFPVLGRHLGGEGGPIGEMVEEHEALRRLHGVLVAGAKKIAADPRHREAADRVETARREVDTLLTDHIDREDRRLFPMAREVLSASEMLEVSQVCREIEAEFQAEPRESRTGRPS